MKKRTKIFLIVLLIIVLLVLFCPWMHCHYEDGGTDMYVATTYTIVSWNAIAYSEEGEMGTYKATRIYWFPDNFKNISQLEEIEKSRDDYWEYFEGSGDYIPAEYIDILPS